MPAADLPARWGSEEWLAALEAWLVPALAAVAVRTTAPVVRDRERFWSVPRLQRGWKWPKPIERA